MSLERNVYEPVDRLRVGVRKNGARHETSRLLGLDCGGAGSHGRHPGAGFAFPHGLRQPDTLRQRIRVRLPSVAESRGPSHRTQANSNQQPRLACAPRLARRGRHDVASPALSRLFGDLWGQLHRRLGNLCRAERRTAGLPSRARRADQKRRRQRVGPPQHPGNGRTPRFFLGPTSSWSWRSGQTSMPG